MVRFWEGSPRWHSQQREAEIDDTFEARKDLGVADYLYQMLSLPEQPRGLDGERESPWPCELS